VTKKSYPAVFMRGGGASGLFYLADDLPTDAAELDKILISAIGSPDRYGVQLDGLGKGTTSSSKSVIVSKSKSKDYDIEYLFAQISVENPLVDWTRSCGNLASAAALFAVEEGLVDDVKNNKAKFRMHQVNRDELIEATVDLNEGLVKLAFYKSKMKEHMRVNYDPTIKVSVEGIGKIDVSVIDATNLVAFVRARDLDTKIDGVTNFLELKDKAEKIRVAVAKSLDIQGGTTNPRILLVEAPRDFRDRSNRIVAKNQVDIIVFALSTHEIHAGLPMTAVMAASVAAGIEGTIVEKESSWKDQAKPIRVGHPSGVDGARPISLSDNETAVEIVLDARRLMSGLVHVNV
jgi:2-methylaconitate cis-trans-isomerase PrpF